MLIYPLPKSMNCPQCDKELDISIMIREAVAYHFIFAEKIYGEYIHCKDCEFGVPEMHYLEMKCVACGEAEWLFILQNKDKENPLKSWSLKLHSITVFGMVEPYNHGLYDVQSREFSIKIDMAKMPHKQSTNVMVDDNRIVEPFLIECDDILHYYLADIGRAGILDDGPIFCPGCDSFSSDTPINRRKGDYKQSKDECFHDYLNFLNEERSLLFSCPRC